MSRSSIITDADDRAEWLENPSVGDILASEFMKPLALDAAKLGEAIGIPTEIVKAVVSGEQRVDGEIDLRLGKYFRMSEGFFLRLQAAYELEEAKRALNGALEAIVPRAA